MLFVARCKLEAVTNCVSKLALHLSPASKGDHRTFDSHDDRISIEVEGVSLDDYFENYAEKIDVIKMDIQGAEMVAVEGMSEILQKNEAIKLFTEFWPLGLQTSGVEPVNYLNALSDHGFAIYNIDEQEKTIEPIHIPKVLATYTPDNQHYTNLFCIRGTENPPTI